MNVAGLMSAFVLLCTHVEDSNAIQTIDYVKTVHLVYMNHLDVGYDGIPQTGFINNVLNTYFQQYFPQAVTLGKQLRDGGYVETFKYTTHPWLVNMYLNCPQNFTLAGVTLKCPNRSHIDSFSKAVLAGDITWHAGPMNIQSENSVGWLYEYSLSMADSLDKYYSIHRKTKVLSQRDVPGMTAAVIPYLVKHGISGVSVGVNGGTAPPDVPKLFRWWYGQQSVIGTWHKGGYPNNPGPFPAVPGGLSPADCVTFPGHPHALCFAFRTDNSGPPTSVQEVLGYYEVLRVGFPNATDIRASTFEDFFVTVQGLVLPNVTAEIGDTWIQGIASDPRKIAEFRAVARVMGKCFLKGTCAMTDGRVASASRYLAKLPEHTWGLNTVYDNGNWTNRDFHKYMHESKFVNATLSWLEQRNFTYNAITALGNHSVVKEINKELTQLTPSMPDLDGYMPVSPATWQKTFTCDADTMLGFGLSGEITMLSYKGNKWASWEYPLAQFMYNTYNQTDTDQLNRQYSYHGGPGFDKTNVTASAHPDSHSWPVTLRDMYIRASGACDVYLHLELVDRRAWLEYGAPQGVWIRHSVRSNTSKPGLDTVLQWYDKTSTRLPESVMLAFHSPPRTSGGYKWMMSKLGYSIDPTTVLHNGSQYQHAVDDDGVYYTSTNGNGLHVYSLDVSVVGPITTPRKPPPVYPLVQPITAQITGMAYTLYNNVWNTNYIQWYPYAREDRDFRTRFSIEFQ